MTPTLADQVDRLLPQTQCEQCGFHGCRPYADAMAAGEAGIDRCPPGGAAGIARLAALLERPIIPLDTTHGVEKPRTLARVVEPDCIGCTKCVQVCPVDAIIGASKVMHTVIADLCTGCELCVPACPVDCIVLDPMPLSQADDPAHADAARVRFNRREARLGRDRINRERRLAASKVDVAAPAARNAVLEALARAKARKKDPP